MDGTVPDSPPGQHRLADTEALSSEPAILRRAAPAVSLAFGSSPPLRTANEFLIYWLPRMEDHPYNLIAFQTDSYTSAAGLTISPSPDTLIRVFMAWKGLEQQVEIPAQQLESVERKGFTAVEWGGAEIL